MLVCIHLSIIKSVFIVYMKIWMPIDIVYTLSEISTMNFFRHNGRRIKCTLHPIWFDYTSSYGLTYNME